MGKLQVRRGILAELPDPLSNGEFGWATDTKQMFIGSGVPGGNTELAAGAGAPEGTAVLSTGETGGTKFLREDGDNSSSWQEQTDYTEKNESFTLDSTDISNKFIDVVGDINAAQTVHLFVENIGILGEVGVDFSYSGNNIFWTGYEFENTLEVGDKLKVFYT